MEHAIKMKIVPISKTQPDINEIIKKIIKLFKLGYVNEQLNVKIQEDFIENTNILDYFTDNKNLTNFKEIHSVINGKTSIKDEIFTNISPIKVRQSKIIKKPNWITTK